MPQALSDVEAALLEPLGVAIHAIDLAKIKVGASVAILGAGPIGLLLLQIARLAGADPVFVTDRCAWRLKAARKYGAIPIHFEHESALERVARETGGRGVDVGIEAAWGGPSIAEAAEMTRLGGRLVLVGIPSDDTLSLKHSTARRKGLSILMSRRMKHMYPRATQLVLHDRVDLEGLVTHRFPLKRAVEAFQLNAAYRDGVIKAVVVS